MTFTNTVTLPVASLGPTTLITLSSPATLALTSTFKESLALLTVKVEELVTSEITLLPLTE